VGTANRSSKEVNLGLTRQGVLGRAWAEGRRELQCDLFAAMRETAGQVFVVVQDPRRSFVQRSKQAFTLRFAFARHG
jgi:hypothetical protein